MRHATTREDRFPGTHYPSGQGVSRTGNTVCWYPDHQPGSPRIPDPTGHRAAIDLVGMAQPGIPPRNGALPATSIGAGSVTEAPTRLRGARTQRKDRQEQDVSDVMTRSLHHRPTAFAGGAGTRTHRARSADSRRHPVAAFTASMTGSGVAVMERGIGEDQVNVRRRSATQEKARCANTGPSRTSLVGRVGNRSDRRQTA